MGAHFKLTPSHRAAIEDQIESLIAMLDGFDAPFEDLEPEDDRCAAADDGCGRLEACQSRFAEHEALATPRYGLDQDSEPVNYREEIAAGQARVLGLAPSASGVWRHSN